MGKMTLRLDDALHEHLAEAAEREHRSLHAEIVVRLERSLGGAVEGERGAAAPAVAVVPDTPESVAEKAKRARAVMEQAQKALAPEVPTDMSDIRGEPIRVPAAEVAKQEEPEPAGAPATKAPAEDKPTPPPPPSSPPRKSIDEVLGDPKHKAKGTVSGRQALLAHEAQLRAQSREDLFSLVCPSRDDHVVGVRCPLCKGIR